MRGNQRGVQINAYRLVAVEDRRGAAGQCPYPAADPGQRGGHPGDGQLVGGDGLDRAPRGRLRRGGAEQIGMPGRQMVDARAAVDQHHRQITHDHARVVITPRAHPAQCLRQRSRQADTVGDLDR
jgi:hypothetical protein